MDIMYNTRFAQNLYERKADRICELYATKLRLTAPRAISLRYGFPLTEAEWPMIGLSVAEHSMMMAQMIGPIYMEFLEVFDDRNIPIETLESEALHHDDAEALTGDAATDVDGVTRAMKDAAEANSIDRQYYDMVCHSYMRMRYDAYESKKSYASRIVKMCDAIDLVFFTQYCVRNGIGMIRRNSSGKGFLLEAFGKMHTIDRRAWKEVEGYLGGDRVGVAISEIMYDHSLPRLEKMEQPELVNLFKLLCCRAFRFPFETYNLVNLPMDYASFTAT